MATTEAEVKGPAAVLVAVNLEDIPSITRGSKAEPLIRQFLDSGMDAAAVTEANSKTFSATLQRYIKDNDLTDQVEVVTRKGAGTFLRRRPQEEVEEAEEDQE